MKGLQAGERDTDKRSLSSLPACRALACKARLRFPFQPAAQHSQYRSLFRLQTRQCVSQLTFDFCASQAVRRETEEEWGRRR